MTPATQSHVQAQSPQLQAVPEKKPAKEKSLVARMAERLGNVDPDKLWAVLKNEQLMMLCIVAEQYGLNPLTKEIYAFPDKGGIIPVIGVDGWVTIARRQPDFQGYEFNYSDGMCRMQGAEVDGYEWIECSIHIKGMTSITVREHLDEVYKPPRKGRSGPWQTHTKRMHRHKVLIQALRMAFGFSGIYDADEAENIRNNRNASGSGSTEVDVTPQSQSLVPPAALSELSAKEGQIREQLLERVREQQCWSAAIEWVNASQSMSEGIKKRIVMDIEEVRLMQDVGGADAIQALPSNEADDDDGTQSHGNSGALDNA